MWNFVASGTLFICLNNAPADTTLLIGVTKLSSRLNLPPKNPDSAHIYKQEHKWLVQQFCHHSGFTECHFKGLFESARRSSTDPKLCKTSKTQRLLAAMLWSLDSKAVREGNNPGAEQSLAQCTVILVHRGGQCQWWHKQYESINSL